MLCSFHSKFGMPIQMNKWWKTYKITNRIGLQCIRLDNLNYFEIQQYYHMKVENVIKQRY